MNNLHSTFLKVERIAHKNLGRGLFSAYGQKASLKSLGSAYVVHTAKKEENLITPWKTKSTATAVLKFYKGQNVSGGGAMQIMPLP